MEQTMVDRINILMKRKGVSLHAFSVESGVAYMTLNNLMKTGGDTAKLPTLRKIAKYFCITLDELIDGPLDAEKKEKAPAQNEQELSEVDLQLLALPEDVKQTVLLLVTQVAAQSAPTVRVSELTARRIQQAIPQDQDSQQQIGDQEQQIH